MNLEQLISERENPAWWHHKEPASEQERRRRELKAAVTGWKLPEPYAPRRQRDTASLIEDVEWLLETGTTPNTIPERVGLAPASLERRLRRHDRDDLANAIRRTQ
jgi:hypothetical protein